MAAKIRKFGFCDETGKICTNVIWVNGQACNIKMGAKVTENRPTEDDPDATVEVQKPYKMYLYIESNCKSVTLTREGLPNEFDKNLITVDDDEKSITFLGAGKTGVCMVGVHHDGTTWVSNWNFNVTSEDWTEDVIDENTQEVTTPGDKPKYEARETVLEVVPSGRLDKVGDMITFEVFTNAHSYSMTTDQKNQQTVYIDQSINLLKSKAAATFPVYFSAQFRQQTLKTHTIEYTTIDDKFTAEDDAVGLQLFNKQTQRTTRFVTSNNSSEEDVLIVLPEESGTLITDRDLSKNISIIEKPTIVVPVPGTTDHIGGLESSPFNTLLNFTAKHVATEWEFSLTPDFSKVIYKETINNATRLTKCNPGLSGGVKTWVRVRYSSPNYDSFWSDPVEIGFGGHGFAGPDSPTYVNPDNPLDGAYYGEVPHSELVDDYDYRGTYNTIKNTVTVDDTGKVTAGHDSGQTMKVGYQVLHPKEEGGKNVLWRCKKAMEPDIFRRNAPKVNSEYWELDERDNMLTPYLLVDRVGVGIIDTINRVPRHGWSRNDDGYSTGPNLLFALENHLDGWIKFQYNGKICYTVKKPICRQIAWTDLAKRDIVYGNRTMRIGRRLYYVRLLTEKEYTMLYTNLTNGKFASMKPADLLLTDKTWVEDFQESSIRWRYTGTGTKEASDPKYREGSWRPVLELIPEGAEPYNNLPDCPPANDEIFQYDPYSDTGYFGIVPYDKVIEGGALITAIGHSGGTNQYLTEGYFKFYWHGRVIYINKKTIKHSVNWQMGLNCHGIHGVDMGGVGKKTVNISWDGKTLACPVSFPTGGRLEPWVSTDYDADALGLGGGDKLNKDILVKEVGKYSIWNECMYRISLGYSGFTEVVSGPDWTSNNQMNHHGGYQIGDNWAELPSVEIQCIYDKDGNGTTQYQRDIGSDKLAVFNPDTATIEWPAGPTNPSGPDGQVQRGSTTEENLTKWCEKYEIDLDWFKKKYTNWATVTITEKFVQQVKDVKVKASWNFENYTPPANNRVIYRGYVGVAGWKGKDDFNAADSEDGLRLVIQIPTTSAILKR